MSATHAPFPRKQHSSDLSLTVLRRLMAQKKHIEQDIHNVTHSLLKPDVKIEYRINFRDYFGKVVEIKGTAGQTLVRVQNLTTNTKRDIKLEDITGILQEN